MDVNVSTMHYQPIVGKRFSMAGSEYEISHVTNSKVRFVSTKGGVQQNVDIFKFHQLTTNDAFNFIDSPYDQVPPSDEENFAMLRRLEYVKAILSKTVYYCSKRIVEPVIEEVSTEIDDHAPPAFSSVCRWVKIYIESNYSATSLKPKLTHRRKKSSLFGDDVEAAIVVLIDEKYLTKKRRPAVEVADEIHAELPFYDDIDPRKVKLPSHRTLMRRITNTDPYQVIYKRRSKYEADKVFRAAGAKKTTFRVLEVVEADGNKVDVVLVDPTENVEIGRPYLTLLVDRYSKCILSYVLSLIPFSNVTVLKALKGAVNEENGLPGGSIEKIIVDNGCDYISNATKNLCNHMGTTIEYGAPRDPNSKPFVERLFRTLNSQLIHQLEGTTFSNPTDKGDYDSVKFCSISLEQLDDYISKWISIYHQSLHDGLKDIPIQVWNQSVIRHPIAHYPANDIELIAKTVTHKSINKGRVRYKNIFWYSHALETINQRLKTDKKSKTVDVYIDELDLSRVFIRDPYNPNAFIQADSTDPEYTSELSLYEHMIIQSRVKERLNSSEVKFSIAQAREERRKLWDEINGNYSKNKRQNRRLTSGNKKVALAKKNTQSTAVIGESFRDFQQRQKSIDDFSRTDEADSFDFYDSEEL